MKLHIDKEALIDSDGDNKTALQKLHEAKIAELEALNASYDKELKGLKDEVKKGTNGKVHIQKISTKRLSSTSTAIIKQHCRNYMKLKSQS